MTQSGNLIPISDEQAKAIGEAVKTLRAAGGYLAEMFDTAPQDIVALLGGNWLKVKRAEQLAAMLTKARERLRARGIQPKHASLSMALPLLQAAADEGREELQDLWARLMAAAADPARAVHFRLEFIEVAKKMAPSDAALLKYLYNHDGRLDGGQQDSAARVIDISRDQLDVSWANLRKLELATPNDQTAVISPFGREFVRAIAD